MSTRFRKNVKTYPSIFYWRTPLKGYNDKKNPKNGGRIPPTASGSSVVAVQESQAPVMGMISPGSTGLL